MEIHAQPMISKGQLQQTIKVSQTIAMKVIQRVSMSIS